MRPSNAAESAPRDADGTLRIEQLGRRLYLPLTDVTRHTQRPRGVEARS
jgi:hypothetical protein